MAENWRIVDTGLRAAAQNIALSRALLEARRAEEIPSTLRFLRFAPCALLGTHQSAEQELHVENCRARHIAIQRRITAGPAVYVDEAQLGWELYLHVRDVGATTMHGVLRRLTHAAATAITALGVEARYRARSDIEVDGRRLASTGVTLDGKALLFQGVVLLDCDLDAQAHVLRAPPAMSFERVRDLARERITDLKRLLGWLPDMALLKRYIVEACESEFGVEFREADLTLSEQARYRTALREVDTAAWAGLMARPASEMPMLEAVHNYAGGALQVTVAFEPTTRTIRQAWFTGEFTVNPRRTVADLEAALRDVPLSRIAQRIGWFFRSRPADLGALQPEDFINVVRRAAGRPLLTEKP